MLNGDQNHQLLDFCCSAFHCCSRLSSFACFLACFRRSSSSASYCKIEQKMGRLISLSLSLSLSLSVSLSLFLTHRSRLGWSRYDIELVDLYHPRLTLDVPHWDLQLQLSNISCTKEVRCILTLLRQMLPWKLTHMHWYSLTQRANTLLSDVRCQRSC